MAVTKTTAGTTNGMSVADAIDGNVTQVTNK